MEESIHDWIGRNEPFGNGGKTRLSPALTFSFMSSTLFRADVVCKKAEGKVNE